MSCFSACLSAEPRQTLADIPLNKCLPDQAIIATIMDALDREVSSGKFLTPALKEILKITNKYPNAGNHAIKEYLSKEDLVRMTELSALTLNASIYELGESQVQRDMHVIYKMLELARTARDNKVVPQQGEKDSNYMLYLLLLRTVFDGEPEDSSPIITGQCNIDFALQQEDDKEIAIAIDKFSKSPEVLELFKLRQKYGLTDGQPFSKEEMPESEARYAIELNEKVTGPLKRSKTYHIDLQNLRRFAKISKTRYEALRDDILKMGGKVDSIELDVLLKMRYETLSPKMQKTWNLWEHIDAEIPSQASKNAQQRQKIIDKHPTVK